MSDYAYLIKDHLGHNISLWDSRHNATYAKSTYHDCNDYEIIPIRAFAAMYLDRIKKPRSKHSWYNNE